MKKALLKHLYCNPSVDQPKSNYVIIRVKKYFLIYFEFNAPECLSKKVPFEHNPNASSTPEKYLFFSMLLIDNTLDNNKESVDYLLEFIIVRTLFIISAEINLGN